MRVPIKEKIAIMIPAFNEQEHIESVIKDCSSCGMDIVVIDDGSSDSTVDKVSGLVPGMKGQLKLIEHKVNKGKGQALITGFDYIVRKGYKGVIAMDADGQHDTGEISGFIEAVKKQDPDVIIGSRLGNTEGMPFVRLATNVFTSWIIASIAGIKVSDVQSGYRYLKTEALKKIKLKTSNFDTEPEIILRAGWHGMKVINIPIKTIYHENFTSYVNPVKDTIKFFRLVFNSLRWKRQFKHRKSKTR